MHLTVFKWTTVLCFPDVEPFLFMASRGSQLVSGLTEVSAPLFYDLSTYFPDKFITQFQVLLNTTACSVCKWWSPVEPKRAIKFMLRWTCSILEILAVGQNTEQTSQQLDSVTWLSLHFIHSQWLHSVYDIQKNSQTIKAQSFYFCSICWCLLYILWGSVVLTNTCTVSGKSYCKVDAGWSIFFNGQSLAWPPSARQCGSFAQEGNVPLGLWVRHSLKRCPARADQSRPGQRKTDKLLTVLSLPLELRGLAAILSQLAVRVGGWS